MVFNPQTAAIMINRSIQRYPFKPQEVIALIKAAIQSVGMAVDLLNPLERNKWSSTPMPAILAYLQSWSRDPEAISAAAIDTMVSNDEMFPENFSQLPLDS